MDTTIAQVSRLRQLAPIREVHVERVAFDVHAMSAGRALESVEYQRGTLFGYEVREYLLAKWGRRCTYCGATGVKLQIEHIQPRSAGGSDRISNLTLACGPCNQRKADQPLRAFLADRPELAAAILRQTKTSLRDAAVMNACRWRIFDGIAALSVPVWAWSGGQTKRNRVITGLAKSHTLDALCVGELGDDVRLVCYPVQVLVAAAMGRGSYQRTRPDRYGFPRLRLPRAKQQYGFATGDMVRAVVPSGKRAGSHMGRVAVRSRGYFNIYTARGLVQGVHHRFVVLLQRSDGYGYTVRQETSPKVWAPRRRKLVN